MTYFDLNKLKAIVLKAIES